MKQIIPFKKELLFKTKVSEITSISLEHTLTLKNDDLISGEFHITGDYKMTEGSINREKFDFKLPFDIALDSRYDVASIMIDIDNFYYEIINNEALQVNIDLYVKGQKIEEVMEEVLEKDKIIEPKLEEAFLEKEKEEVSLDRGEVDVPIEITHEIVREEFDPVIEPVVVPKVVLEEVDKDMKSEFNLFEHMDNSDTYMTYYVYIVKEEDTLDKILEKYNTTKEEVALYNNILDIKPGMKLIIPSNCNE